jgi:16S rRNA (cytosine967-C5)-methyltransferase
MSLAGSQQKIFLRLIGELRPHWRRDPNLPARIQALFAANRSFGSRDRKLYRELIYTTLRYLPWVEPLLDVDPDRATQTVAWLAADLPATRAFRAAMAAGWPACPPTLAAKAAHLRMDPLELVPAWLSRHAPLAVTPANLDTLNSRAPLWLRLQTDHAAKVLDEFATKQWQFQRSTVLPNAVQLLTEADVKTTVAWKQGLVEVPDLGSQLILESIGLEPGGRWLDACAGAGGKTLQLARLLGTSGHVDAHDIRREALQELAFRASRAGLCHLIDDKPAGAADRVAIVTAAPAGTYDGVLVDAPCSGSGTWRRSPHLKWTTSAADVTHAAEKQRALLDEFSARVRPGGRLVYATCSLSRFENEEVVAGFLAAHPDFVVAPFARTFGFEPGEPGLAILPARHNTDGFFVASLRRNG